MTPDESVRVTADRLRAVSWQGHGYRSWSRAALLKEYFRRAARWAKAFQCEPDNVFFDIAGCVDPGVRADQQAIDEVLAAVEEGGWYVTRLTPSILHWAAVRAVPGFTMPEGLEDPFEPLIVLFERDGGFHLENGFVDLDYVSVPTRGWRERDNDPAIASLDPADLDDMDRAGSLAQFGRVLGPDD
ncbi:hypothetical protein [Symbioplanes lichenis]|uniref:hypothetical protein n=1 Tax=Symbioplanes lichenis TaxID=1629072 RepID=UPI00273A52C1|nr:hypothetical protein [Actinoplanes lichenis]